jgi:hypothetical protein
MTRWGEAGLSPKAIQALAGHSDSRLSQEIYQQATDTPYNDAAERLASQWWAALPRDRCEADGLGRDATIEPASLTLAIDPKVLGSVATAAYAVWR